MFYSFPIAHAVVHMCLIIMALLAQLYLHMVPRVAPIDHIVHLYVYSSFVYVG